MQSTEHSAEPQKEQLKEEIRAYPTLPHSVMNQLEES